MADTISQSETAAARAPLPPRRSLGVRLLRLLGWLLIAAGVIVLLYLVYSLLFTNLSTHAAQADMLERWETQAPLPAEAAEPAETEAENPAEEQEEPQAAPIDPDGAVAVLEFARPGSDEPLVHEDPLFVVNGVTLGDLTRGPGHYPGTALPGQEGNFAVAGHRTTYGAPFHHLDQLEPGDEIRVTDRDRQTHVYEVVEQRIVGPGDSSVLGPDPLGTGHPTLTLTTCHPRFSARQRLIVFAELQ